MIMSAAVCWILTRTSAANVSEKGEFDKAISLALSGVFLALAAISTGMLIPSATLTTFVAIGLVFPLVAAFLPRTWLNPNQNSIVPTAAATSIVTLIVVLLAIGSLLGTDPGPSLLEHGLLRDGHLPTVNVQLILAPLLLFVLNACATIIGANIGLRMVGMHRGGRPRRSRHWVGIAFFLLLLTIMLFLMLLPFMTQSN